MCILSIWEILYQIFKNYTSVRLYKLTAVIGITLDFLPSVYYDHNQTLTP